jgi:hypothetical protein
MAWTGIGEECGYEVKFREKARAWSIKFPAAPESTRAVESTLEGQPASEVQIKGFGGKR